MSYRKKINDNRKRSAQERAANDLHERLEKLLLTGRENAQRRWFWELLQNARDMAGPEGVRVQVEHTEERLCFRHNGKVFNSKELSRLTEQDSSKREETGSDRSIGRFGTGFLTTHLLSRVVRVKGVVHDDGEPPKPVNLVLDRRGDTPEALRTGVERAFGALDDLDQAPNATYTKGDFNTSFCYELSAEGRQVMETGLADLRLCLPLTLALNDKIASVEVVHDGSTYYVSERVELAEGVARVAVACAQANETTHSEFIVLLGEAHLNIALPIKTAGASVTLKSLPENFPRLFCAFPLIGSEEFPLPIVLNSERFHPTEQRHGVLLTDADHFKPKENKELIEQALALYWRLLRLAAEQSWQQLYVLAGFRNAPKLDWLSKKWFDTTLIEPTRERLLREPVVETEAGEVRPFHSPKSREAYIPRGQNAELRLDLWRLTAAFRTERLPKQEHLEAWHDRLWTDTQCLYPEDLLPTITATEDVKGLSDLLQRNEVATLEWLCDVVQYLEDTGNSAMLNVFRGKKWYVKRNTEIYSKKEKIECPILPDQHGRFKLLNQLFIDQIRDQGLKDVLDSLGRDVRAELLHPDISISDASHKSLASEDLAKDIEDRVRKRISSGSRDSRAFLDLLRWFDANEIRAQELFPALYKDQHLLQTAEEARAMRQQAAEAKELAKEVGRLKAEVKRLSKEVGQTPPPQEETAENEREGQIKAEQLMEAWAAVKNALGELGDIERKMALKDLATWLRDRPGLFEHVTESSKKAYLMWIDKVCRAKEAVRAGLNSSPDYDCTGWTDDVYFPTIVKGVVYHGLPLTMVIRPADGGFIVLYDDEEKEVLSRPDAELWIEGGGFEAQRMTLGKLASWLGVNRFPLEVPAEKPVLLHLS